MPITWPPTTPPPAKTAGKTAGQWSRPGTSPGFSSAIRGRPAELAEHDHQRLVEQAAHLEVVEQGRDRLVQRRQQAVAEPGEVGDVGVPGLDDPHRRLHDRDARLDQPPGDQERAAEQVPAVAVDQAGVLALGVERPAHLAVAEHGQRGVLLIGERRRRGRDRGLAQQVPAPVQPLRVEPGGQRQAVVARLRAGSGRGGAARGRAGGRGIPRPARARSAGPRRAAVGRATPLGMPSAAVPQVVQYRRIAGEVVARGDAVQVARPRGLDGWPVSTRWTATRWFPSGCDIDRTIASRRPVPRGRGRCSQTWMPGTAVSIGLNSPRIPSGASGFMSKESCCPRPPLSRITITDRARPEGLAAGCRRGPRREQARQPHAQQARVADLDETAPRLMGQNAVVPARDVACSWAPECEPAWHGRAGHSCFAGTKFNISPASVPSRSSPATH